MSTEFDDALARWRARLRECPHSGLHEGYNSLIDEMLSTGLRSSLLHAKHRLVSGFSGKERVSPEALPVTSALRDTTHIHHRPERDVHALSLELLTHRAPALTQQRTVPGGRDRDARRECRHKVNRADAGRRVVQTEARPFSNGCDVAYATFPLRAHAGECRHLVLDRPGRDECLGFGVRGFPCGAKVGYEWGPRSRRGVRGSRGVYPWDGNVGSDGEGGGSRCT